MIEDREALEHPLHAEIRRWKRAREKYFDVARKAEQMYECEDEGSLINRPARLNIFWSIVNTLKPALYAQPPKPQIQRRWPNRDITARVAAQVLERCTLFQIERSGYDAAVSKCIDDHLVVGQGTVWVRYEPVIKTEVQRVPVFEMPQQAAPEAPESMEMGEDGEYPETPQEQQQDIYVDQSGQPVDPATVKRDDEGYYIDGETVETLVDERVVVDYIHWSDLLFEPARTWAEVRKVARKTHITKKEFIQKFGEDAYRAYSYSTEKAETEVEKEITRGRICVYEIWDKDENKVSWLAEGHNEILKESDPYLVFDEFFPCPPPLFATIATGLIPRPDICFYQDQQETLHYLCQKAQDIARFIKVLSIGGAENPELVDLLSKPNGSHISLSNFQMYLQQGGVKTAFEVLSMADHAAILQVLHDAIEKEKQQIYDITGISDIVRGVSQASETLGAQQIKSQYANARISERQRKVANFCRDVVSLIAQVIKNHFQLETVVKMAGVGNDPEVIEFITGAVDLLRNDAVSDFKIEIETDSTKFTNTEEAKQSAVELTNALGGLFNALLPHAATIPQLVPVISELTLFTAKQFEAGREVHGKLEQALTEMEKTVEENRQREIEAQQQEQQLEQQKVEQDAQAQQAAPEQQAGPDPKILELEQKRMIAEAEIQLKAAKIKSDEELERQKILLADDRERKAQEMTHEREKLKAYIDAKSAQGEQKGKGKVTRTWRITPGENGERQIVVDEVEDLSPEHTESGLRIEGLTVKSSKKVGQIVRSQDGQKIIQIQDT